MGWVFIIGFLFCIQDLDNTINTSTNFPVMQIIVDSVGEKGGIVLMVMLMLACWFCGFASVTVCIEAKWIQYCGPHSGSSSYSGQLAHDLCLFSRWCHAR